MIIQNSETLDIISNRRVNNFNIVDTAIII